MAHELTLCLTWWAFAPLSLIPCASTAALTSLLLLRHKLHRDPVTPFWQPFFSLSCAAGEDLAHLLRTLSIILEPSHMLYCPAFHNEPPSACPGWKELAVGVWAAPAVPAAAAEGAAEGAAGAQGAVEIDLTGEGGPPPPETPTRQVWCAVHCGWLQRLAGWACARKPRTLLIGD